MTLERPQRIRVVRYEAPTWGVGELVLADGVPVAHEFPNRRREPAPPPPDVDADALVLAERLGRFFRGEREWFGDVDLGPTLELIGATPFEARIVLAIQAIPYGATASYLEVAERAGALRAARAAGNVCARGTLDVIVPYHRVIASDGSIGSYGSDGGLRTKRRLLALEGVRL